MTFADKVPTTLAQRPRKHTTKISNRIMTHKSNPRNSVVLLMVVLTLIGGAVQAEEDSIHRTGEFQVRYQTKGEHAIALDDRNHNGVPDQAEDILTQVIAAHVLFVEVLGFPDPFHNERFLSATVLDIRIRNRDVLKCNGLAYDELQRSKSGDWIGMKVASSVHANSNGTPAHEFFHLIHYSTSYFKNSWFAEGTARWSEFALGSGSLGPAPKLDAWPLSHERAAAVFKMSYDASEQFWNPLAARLDANGVIPDSPALKRLQAMRYTDGSHVLMDLNLTGWRFIRDVIIELGVVDDIAFRKLGYDRWTEANQFSKENNSFILGAVEKVFHRYEVATRADKAKTSGKQDSALKRQE